MFNKPYRDDFIFKAKKYKFNPYDKDLAAYTKYTIELNSEVVKKVVKLIILSYFRLVFNLI